jgi:AcrR family transcriptional regulator
MGAMKTGDPPAVTTEGKAPPGDGWARRRQRVADHIERCALEVIAELGPDATVEQMADSAGISARTFFRYFPTRDDVMSALPRRQNEELFSRVLARPSSEGVLEAFIAAVHEPQVGASDPELTWIWGKARRHWPMELPAAQMIAQYRRVIADRIGAPLADGRVEVMAAAIANVIWVAFRRWQISEGTTSLGAVLEEYFNILSRIAEYAGPQARRPRGRAPSIRS